MPTDITLPPAETLVRGVGTRDWLVDRKSCPPLGRHGIEAAGFTDLGPGYEMIRPEPYFANIVVCCEGTPDVLIDGKWVPAKAGTVLVAPRGVPHGVRSPAAHATTSWVAYDTSAVKSPRHGWDAGRSRLTGVKDHRPLLWALQGLYTEATGPKDAQAMEHWTDLIVFSAGRLVDEHRADNAAALRPAWETVDADLGQPWTAESIAELANLSPSHFRRLCRQQLGRSPAQQLAHLRMQRAAALLTTTPHKLTAIATAVGYENTFAFSVAFKRWSGQAPAYYRAATNAARAH